MMQKKQRMNLREALPLAGITVSTFIFCTSEFMPVALLTDIALSFSVTESQAGMLISVYAWMVMLLSLPLMIAASRIGFRRLFLIIVALFAFGQLLSSLATSYFMLMAARMVVACAHAIFWSIAPPMAVRVVSEDHRHMALGMVVMGESVALIAGLPLGRVIGLALGWRMTFACVAIITVIIFIYLYFVLLFTTDLNNMEKNFNNSRYRNTFLQLIAALLFLIGTIIFLTQEILSLNDTTNPTQ